ncbi:MAG: OmpA family protein, partial [Flavobacterium sp.]|uniref:OmpA family protein n=1 Tax=Flavobacterium sp. TaxID=239 RepID=UPI003BDBAAD4
ETFIFVNDFNNFTNNGKSNYMKNYQLLIIVLFCISLSSYAQKDQKDNDKNLELTSVETNNEIDGDTYNKWSLEFDLGQSRGGRPYSEGYFGSDPGKFLGGFQINHYGLGVRYMLSPKFGLKSHFSYDDIKKLPGSESKEFKLEHLQLSLEGVVNAMRLFDLQNEFRRFGLLFHFGIQVSQMSPQMNINKGKKELNGGLIVGVTPSIRVLNNFSIFLDVALNSNIRQHLNWDGSYSDPNNNLIGSLFTTSLGFSYSFGKDKIHGDWAIIKEINDKRLDSLNNRIGEIETLMNDSDKDGVPDYLDAEQNSIAGVAVDTKGRMVDKNNNGVPDELERYVNNSINSNNNATASMATENAVLQLINDGYIAAYFETTKATPNSASASNIGFILNYLKNNPGKNVEIAGYADQTGDSETNNKLANDRAQNVKSILVKAGISESRITIMSRGEDDSVDKKSDWAKRLVRKTVFKIKQ